MGSPEKYYKMSLQKFAYALNFDTDKLKSDVLLKENDEEILEQEILDCKNKIDQSEFYFYAGRVYGEILIDTENNDGCDGFNACIGGLNMFMTFIGLKDEEEE